MKRSPSPKRGLEVVYERQRGAIVAIRVRGHAGFAVAGQDIVCAAVSALVLTAAHGLRRHCAVTPKVSDTAAEFRLELADGGNARATAVLETTITGLEAIAATHPGYMRIKQAKIAAGRKARE